MKIGKTIKCNETAKAAYFRKLSNNPEPKDFWKTVKPLISDKSLHSAENYMLEYDGSVMTKKLPISLMTYLYISLNGPQINQWKLLMKMKQ